MAEQSIGIRELKQNASAAVARAAAGEALVVTDHGRPVARLVPLGASRMSELVTAGLARPPRGLLADLPRPQGAPSTALSRALDEDREDQRY
ncbi:type II toxin-antitoxin system prevent-host-death family antitoxin [Ornithinimicrobium kibberense]|uniref:Antitoxin n=1 Tax=Ornithinimicrobium kibberense TaxID=282060 RepID=A0ABV5V637_9MICO|nr:type II toxin-antitoxin system prevent-host-death family antitoxin [Ornithinimicrobium kibberense]